MCSETVGAPSSPSNAVVTPILKKVAPYWYPYTTMAKGRWLGREILEVVSTEFRDRSVEYYRYALESGVTTINGRIAKPDSIIRDGDRIENIVHRHEPPVTSKPVKVLFHDVQREFIVVDKPGSIPVHASGRYFRNTVVEILKNELGYSKVYTVNRLDRLTSGLMIIPLSAERARSVSEEFMAGTVRKEYIARCQGEFPVDEVVCEMPLLTVDRQMGLNIVHPEGKHAKTIFNRLHYDANTGTSVIHCKPLTGRSHQLRVHLQYLGHPIANDPIYSETKIWGRNLGKDGIDLIPNNERLAPVPPPHIKIEGNPEILSDTPAEWQSTAPPASASKTKRLPRETGHDIGMGSPVALSSEAVVVITRLRNTKDEDEDWSRWRDVIFRARGALSPQGMKVKPLPPQNRRNRGGPGFVDDGPKSNNSGGEPCLGQKSLNTATSISQTNTTKSDAISPVQLSPEEALGKLNIMESSLPPTTSSVDVSSCTKSWKSEADNDLNQDESMMYCTECYVPLRPDPKPERLYIFLHALRYTTSLGSFETEMPEWAEEGWVWDRS